MKTRGETASSAAHSSQRELQDEIARTRAALGETVDALAGKLDVKGRARESMATATHRTSVRVRRQPLIPVAGASVLAAVVVLVLWRRHR